MTWQEYNELPRDNNISYLCAFALRLDKHHNLINCSNVSLSYGVAMSSNNGSRNDNSTDLPYRTFVALYGTWHVIVTSVLLGLFILCTIIGNVFVVAAIILEKTLQSVSNYLILSLSVADLMVATLVMPISALHELSRTWWLGIELCDIWICFDVLCCTASILHLVAIAIDRYWAVTNIDYIRRRTAKRIIFMIVLVWTISIIISIPARFHLKRNQQDEIRTVINQGECLINQDEAYTIFSVVGAFYCPMIFMLILYMRIYKTARARIRRKHFQKHAVATMPTTMKPKVSTSVLTKEATIVEATINMNASSSSGVNVDIEAEDADVDSLSLEVALPNSHAPNNNHVSRHYKMTTLCAVTYDDESTAAIAKENGKCSSLLMPKQRHRRIARQELVDKVETQRERLEHKRERKAARTLAIITGCFLLCWLPFFVHAAVMPFCVNKCAAKELPRGVLSFFLWQGYLNSLLNPVIYTIFAPDFRNAFRKILFGRYYKAGGRH